MLLMTGLRPFLSAEVELRQPHGETFAQEAVLREVQQRSVQHRQAVRAPPRGELRARRHLLISEGSTPSGDEMGGKEGIGW